MGVKCKYEDCPNEGDTMVYNRTTNSVEQYCDYHAELVVDQNKSEYTTVCPHCGCVIPVN